MQLNSWAVEALKSRGIIANKDGSFEITFTKGKKQKVSDLNTAIRQQKHIVDQQKEEQKENEAIGKLMRDFHEIVCKLTKMTTDEYGKKKSTMKELELILDTMSKKREDLRKDGYNRLCKVMNMLSANNLPAANLASMASLDRMRRRWLVNAKVIDKSLARLTALENLKESK